MEVWTGGMKTGGWLVGSMEVWTGGMKKWRLVGWKYDWRNAI